MLEFKNFSIQEPVSIQIEDMSLQASKIYGLAGASGAGKSTILKTIAGFGGKTAGALRWENESIENFAPKNRPVSMLFQHQNLFMHLTLRQNIALGLNIGGKKSKLRADEENEIRELAQKLNIEQELDRLPRACSGGQRARAALARVILDNRRIVLLDEAFHSLGPAQKEQIREIIEENLIAHDRLVIFSSHHSYELFSWSQEILWLDGKKLNSPRKTKAFFTEAPESAKRYFGKDLHRFS